MGGIEQAVGRWVFTWKTPVTVGPGGGASGADSEAADLEPEPRDVVFRANGTGSLHLHLGKADAALKVPMKIGPMTVSIGMRRDLINVVCEDGHLSFELQMGTIQIPISGTIDGDTFTGLVHTKNAGDVPATGMRISDATCLQDCTIQCGGCDVFADPLGLNSPAVEAAVVGDPPLAAGTWQLLLGGPGGVKGPIITFNDDGHTGASITTPGETAVPMQGAEILVTVARRRQLTGITHDGNHVSWEMDMGPGVVFPFDLDVDGDTCTGTATTMNGEMKIFGERV